MMKGCLNLTPRKVLLGVVIAVGGAGLAAGGLVLAYFGLIFGSFALCTYSTALPSDGCYNDHARFASLQSSQDLLALTPTSAKLTGQSQQDRSGSGGAVDLQIVRHYRLAPISAGAIEAYYDAQLIPRGWKSMRGEATPSSSQALPDLGGFDYQKPGPNNDLWNYDVAYNISDSSLSLDLSSSPN